MKSTSSQHAHFLSIPLSYLQWRINILVSGFRPVHGRNDGRVNGFSLLEMLISLAIFAVILSALFFTEFQSAKAITQDSFQENLLVLTHNTYETTIHK